MKKIKVCFVLPSHWQTAQGGAEYQARLLIERMLATGKFDIHYLARNANESHSDKYKITVVKGIPGLKRYTDSFDAISLYRELRRVAPDVIYQRSATAYTGVCAAYAKLHKIPMVWHIASDMDVIPWRHGFSPRLVHWWVEKKIMEFGLYHAKSIVAQTVNQAVLLNKHYARPITAVVPNFHPGPKEVLREGSEHRVLWVGNIRPVKQPKYFLALAKQLRDLNCVKLQMIGRAPSDPLTRRTFLEEVALLPNLDFSGEQSQHYVDMAIAQSDVLVNTSEYEGLSNTFIQAWMRKVPVVALNTNPEALLNRDSLGFCAEGSFQALVKHVRELLEDSFLRQSMGERARAYALNKYGMKNADDLIELITSLC